MHVHLIGIGGTGLSAIAQVLLEKGYEVSGSDRVESAVTQNLHNLGVRVYIGHQSQNIAGADLVLRSSAVTDENVEVQAAFESRIPVVKRAEFLERLIDGQECIAVAGTHGKTTTTAMLAWVFHGLGLDPSYIIGSSSLNLGNNAHTGKGKYFVIEADEYDYMFLGLIPKITIVTNIEHDHPDCFPTYSDVLEAFKSFTSRTLPSGIFITNGEDPGASQLLAFAKDLGLRCVTYGLGSGRYDIYADDLTQGDLGGYQFTVSRKKGGHLVDVTLQVPGLHNVRNALACLAVVNSLDLSLSTAATAMQEFKGTARRFELVGEISGVTIISDYAHHPTEIQATLAAARTRYAERRIWAVWQPHTFSRTTALLDQFSKSFEDADRILITEVFAAREAPPPGGYSTQSIVESIHGDALFFPELTHVRSYLGRQLAAGDVVIILSAGDANRLGSWLITDLVDKQDQKPDD
ncbi:MAG: UDP-N-acetylmuramate--L-alanine ligase [Chloroflexi bacterium RBG_16_54_18]|nr:MAG: UDP-N-acetylmuramate--L-alanine ligase [Chloroflexi bacterium RBG_16_54_18]